MNKVICELCGASIAGGSWVSGDRPDRHPSRYLKNHQRRCEEATEEERAYFRENRKWPRRAGAKRQR